MEANAKTQAKRIDWMLICLMVIMIAGYILIHDLYKNQSAGKLLDNHHWDSYTLQALSWREGRADLGRNYSYLEIAEYQGKFYVSFPPFPSVVIFPLTFVFGASVPSNLLVMIYALIAAAFAYKIFRHAGFKEGSSALLALLVVWGSNAMWMSTVGGVWFQAQLLNLALLLGAFYAALRGKRILAYALVACAVGCRPFSMVCFIALFVYFYVLDRGKSEAPKRNRLAFFFRTALKQRKCFIIPICIAAAYMCYNFIRFGNVFEFGHNYLPEFIKSPDGQFNVSYLFTNLKRLFLRFVKVNPDLTLDYPPFDGFCIFVANPIFVLSVVYIVTDIVCKKLNAARGAIIAAMFLNIIFTCMHKTLGGWQFGARYTVDIIPLVCFYMALASLDTRSSVTVNAAINRGMKRSRAEVLPQTEKRLKYYEIFVCAFGIMFNVYGAMAMTFLQ